MKVSFLCSLASLSSPLSSLSSLSLFSFIDKLIFDLTKRVVERGCKLQLHWVKAHSSIVQNDMIDAAAKKEALNFRRETLSEEKPQLPGEFTLKGQLVTDRQEIAYNEWRPDLDKCIMKAARSYHARKVMAGVQQWRGLKSNWAALIELKEQCIYCRERHFVAFGLFLQKCSRCRVFRDSIKALWSDVTWDDDLLEGRVSHRVVSELIKSGHTREEAIKEAGARVRKWAKCTAALCKELRGRSNE